MKTLYLFRHGEAEANKCSDYDRELTEKGITMTEMMGRHLKSSGVVIDVIISSGAPRALSTAETIAAALDFPISEIVTDDIVYDAKIGDELLPLFENVESGVSSLLIVGHNPVLSDLGTLLTKDYKKIDLSKSSVVRIDFDSPDWESIKTGSGNFIYYRKTINGKVENIN